MSVRLKIVDLIRGLAIAGVVIFHIGWDLEFTGFLPVNLSRQSAWLWFGRSLAGTFMVLVGVSLVLAHSHGIRWKSYFRRLLVITVAAAAISAVTWLVFPTTFIYFGILHAIATATVVATPFLWLPTVIAVAIGALFVTIPFLFDSAFFNTRWLAWTGFAQNPPPSNDFVPIFPWLGLTLLGMGFAKGVVAVGFDRWLAHREPSGMVPSVLVWMGRNSLVIYLIHQPILLSLIMPLAWLVFR
ncbi:MAG: DUF1624 domain-containing protein [Oricola sp.]|nr:DUF1624 domain-containing protein [Oricola sp.]